MADQLRLNTDNYSVKTCKIGKKSITYRAFENLTYCKNPVDSIQKLSLYVPEDYYSGKTIGKYSAETAPIFIPNTVGGYMPGPTEEPGLNTHTHRANALFTALEHGLVACSIGVRGRTSGKASVEFFEGSTEGSLGEATGRMVGRAPAFIVDYKAGIRYLRFNKDLIPGNTDRMITNGTSAGGALSALAGTSGNNELYAPYLEEIGAADERDDVFAANCYCPIHNLEHADAAYEWEFNGIYDYHRTRHERTESGIVRVPDEGKMTPEQVQYSMELKTLFPEYLNSLELRAEDGTALKLDENGDGSFKEYIKMLLIKSAQKEMRDHRTQKTCADIMAVGSEVGKQDFFTFDDKKVVIENLDWNTFIRAITRMKAAPAFDDVELKSPENEEFGDEDVDARHFTAWAAAHSKTDNSEIANETIIHMMNPVSLLYRCRSNPSDETQNVAPYWRIRHGSYDRDTSFAIPVILATKLQNEGKDVDFALPWGMPHSGDYDLDEVMAWIDRICTDAESETK